ncbi:Ser/Thr protein kinase RdoA involved in Cpx stress response, MazF antagonist [Evansella caseinilytica]|uniref:Ser/Thr protein kinase RdoA involved in Cpx stress response, MazF antagonist n=1 Tax=Evansella caseinilytica TaxID=1503961 RepID=A0A1H3NPG0_9BACI|nr:phosphotransferase [Evansella caseinilytica]SDY90653.1 Ser/Thr protein kinase RdoA involved in Cpx stress response, MazF antagonist [Evansella caseinilytica]
MKKEVESIFTSAVLHQGAAQYSVELESLKELAGFENFIYSGEAHGKTIVLRYCHSSHRTMEQIDAEMDWLHYLKRNGAAVCGPLPSVNGRLAEEIAVDGSEFYLSAFEMAEGKHVDINTNKENTTFFYRWGKAIGELHRLTKDYQPSAGTARRDDYMEMSSEVFADFLPDDPTLKQEVNHLIEVITALPKHSANYFLTHTDLHSGNFYYNGKRLWLFDFDDCAYHYLVHDLAMPLYYSLWKFTGTSTEQQAFAETFFTSLLAGYLSEYELSLLEIENLPLFLRLRDCDLFAILQKEWHGEMTEKQENMLSRMRHRIVQQQPVIDLPYETLYQAAKKMINQQ